MTQPRAVLFDAYGTLFDVHALVLQVAPELGRESEADLQALSNLWRGKQLEYTWLLALMNRYEDFRRVTEAALRAAARRLGIEASEPRLRRLLDAYLSPPLFPDVMPALEKLTGIPLGILSNGTPEMIASAVAAGNLTHFFTCLISADRARTYKPSPAVYALGPATLGIPAAEILFVSSNAWDAAGAKAYGYRVCWCNRSGAQPDDLGFPPDFTVAGLGALNPAGFPAYW